MTSTDEASQVPMSGERPLFSVIIPTRNRSAMARVAILSVLEQNFDDFELIVSDNSDVPMGNSGSNPWLEKAQTDKRVKYVHWPTPLEMPAHFDKASRLATGQYVAMMTDRFLMRPSSLKVLNEIISEELISKPQILVWPMQSTFSESLGVETTKAFTKAVDRMPLRDMLQRFLQFSEWNTGEFYNNNLPRGINCLYHRDVSESIIASYGKLFGPYSPDYAASFLFCAKVNEIIFVDFPLYMSHGGKSTGLNSFLYGVYSSSVDPFEGCPLRIDTVFNTVVRDFVSARLTASDSLSGMKFNLEGYYLSIYSELVDKELAGSPMPLKKLFRELEEKVNSLPTDLRTLIRFGQIELNLRRRHRFYYWRTRLLLQSRLNGVVSLARLWIANARGTAPQLPRYSDALAAAKSTDHYLD